MKKVPTIPMEALDWEPCGTEGDEHDRLLAAIQIGSQLMHLEAIEVYEDPPGIYRAKYEGRDNALDVLMDIEQTAFETTEIEGRHYVLYATPFGA